jgi:hypothetical protein
MGGASFSNQPNRAKGVLQIVPGNLGYIAQSAPHHITAAYADYIRGNWHLAGEYRRDFNTIVVTEPGTSIIADGSYNAGFVSLSYRINKHLELGTYHSRFVVDTPLTADSPSAQKHIFDGAATARVDIARYWNVKVEGHFLNGYGDVFSAHGFYSGSNPDGLKPRTNLLVIRTGWNF